MDTVNIVLAKVEEAIKISGYNVFDASLRNWGGDE